MDFAILGMHRKPSSLLLGFVFVIGLNSGCATNTGRGALAGSALGSGVGALVGLASGDPKTGAVVGAALGGGLGTAIGADADFREKERQDQIELANAEAAARQPLPASSSLSLDEIVRLSQPDAQGNRVSDEVLLEYIRTSQSTYRLTPADLQYLSANGVSDRVQKALLQRTPEAAPRIIQPTTHRTVVVHEPPPVVIYQRGWSPYYVRPMPVGGIYLHGRIR